MNKDIPILLVEDDLVDVMAFRRAMGKKGMKNLLYTASNGKDALKFLQKVSSWSGLIVLDLNMPEMDGLEFLEVIRGDKGLRHLPVVVLTSSTEKKDREASLGFGVVRYIIKPDQFEHYVEAVGSINTSVRADEAPSPYDET